MNQLSVGIDVGSEKNDTYIMNPDKTKNRYFTCENTPEGCQKLVRHILAAVKEQQVNRVIIGMEATSVYGEGMAYLLATEASFADLDCKVHVMNPKMVKAHKETLPETHKTDKDDALAIADKVYGGNIGEPLHVTDEDLKYQSLRILTRTRFQAVQDVAKLKQRYANLVFRKVSGFFQDDDIVITSATMLAINEHYETVDALAYDSHENLVELIKDAGRNRVKDPDAYADRVQKAAKRSFRLPKQKVDSINAAMHAIVTSIRGLEKEISVLDDQIKKELEGFRVVLDSIPGIGPVYCAGIMAEIGNINNFKNDASVAKYAGLAWKKNQSSKHNSEDTRMFQTGNRYLRYYLIEAANSVRRHVPEYGDFYNLKCKEVKTHKHKRAISLTARKLVRLVFRLLKDNCLYEPRDA